MSNASNGATNGLSRAAKPVPVVVSANYKGGVGKSLTSRVLAQGMLNRPDFTNGKRILLIDFDPQGNLSQRWKLQAEDYEGSLIPVEHPDFESEEVRSSITDLWLPQLGEGEESLVPVPYPTEDKGIDCVPINEAHMLTVNRQSTPEIEAELAQLLIDWLRSEQVAEKYCLVIIDTQPSKTPLIDIALMVGTHCYVPFIPEEQSIQGVYSILTYIVNRDSYRRDGSTMKMMGLLPNMVRSGVQEHRNNLNSLRHNQVYSNLLMPCQLALRTVYSSTDNPNHLPGSVTASETNSKAKAEALRFTDFIISQLTEED